MGGKREFLDHPVVGVGGVVILDGCALLIRRGSEPMKGVWSIPGGTLELGETLVEGVRRELREETSLDVRVLDLIEVFERIFPGPEEDSGAPQAAPARPRYHFVIVDYLCEAIAGTPRAASDVTDVALVQEEDLPAYNLTVAATRVVRKAFAMARARTQPAR
ncbi:MAG: NUDIX domain-containing protein [Acidobacteria bacterium]|nr:NUDIX domain-containing protein [Acidobacteriota bacterium]MBI3662647.1 NUDIX domain-containing protein [Acidobacteriota bacterium]